MSADPASPAPRSRRYRLWITLACLLAGPFLLELGMRFLLFHPSDLASSLGAGFRDARRYADPMHSDDYWKLRYLLAEGLENQTPQNFHPVLGWTHGRVDPESLVHVDESKRGQRRADKRPILLYGASFAACKVPVEGCFEGMFKQRPEGKHAYILNYGAHGYGPGQALLLLRGTIDDFAERDPLVILGLVADSDFDRAALGFRGRPKPRFDVVDGELKMHLPVEADIESYLASHPVEIRSYAWNHFVHGTEILPRSIRSRLRGTRALHYRKREIIGAILSEITAELEARDVPYLFLIFHRESSVRLEGPATWREPFLFDLLDSLEAPYLSTKPVLLQAAADLGVDVSAFYLQEGEGRAHPNALGNEVVLDALLEHELVRGLLPPQTGELDPADSDAADDPEK